MRPQNLSNYEIATMENINYFKMNLELKVLHYISSVIREKNRLMFCAANLFCAATAENIIH